MEFIGCLKGCVGERSGDSANGHWCRRSYLVEEVATFNQKKAVFEVTDGEVGRFAKWDSLIGKNVIVTFEIDANEYQGRWFNNIRAWQIKSTEPEEPTEEQVLGGTQ